MGGCGDFLGNCGLPSRCFGPGPKSVETNLDAADMNVRATLFGHASTFWSCTAATLRTILRAAFLIASPIGIVKVLAETRKSNKAQESARAELGTERIREIPD